MTSPLDDVQIKDFAVTFFNEALRSLNLKTCFSFALRSLETCPKPASLLKKSIGFLEQN